MDNIIVYVLFAVGLVLIVKGGDLFVDASSEVAKLLGVPEFIIGATIVSFATTMPELIVSVLASLDGRLDMAVGNAIGSVTANTGLIMALSIIFMPSRVERRMYAPKSFMLLCAVVSLWLLCAKGTLYAKSAVVLFVILGLYITENIQSGKRKMIKTTGYISKRGLVWQ